MKIVLFLFAASLLTFGLYNAITSAHKAYSPLDTYVNTMIKKSADSTREAKEIQDFLNRDYQLEVYEDSTVIFDGLRKVAVLPYDSTQKLDNVISADNE